MNSSRGEYPSICHKELWDITADLLSEVCHSVSTEPCLQPVTDEQLMQRTANKEDGAWLDIVVESFWGEIGNVHFLMYGYLIP